MARHRFAYLICTVACRLVALDAQRFLGFAVSSGIVCLPCLCAAPTRSSSRFEAVSKQINAAPCRVIAPDSQRCRSLSCRVVSHRCVAISIPLVPLRAVPFRFAFLPCVTARRLALPLRFGSCVALRSFSVASRIKRLVAYPLPIPACPLHAQLFRSSADRLRSHLCRGFSPLIYSVAARLKSRLCLAIQ